MGCDAHALIERKGSGDQWWTLCEPDITRDSHLFGVLAGVRGDVTPLIKPRGLPEPWASWKGNPDDSPPSYVIDYQDGDYHHWTWLTYPELLQALEHYKATERMGDCNLDLEAIIGYMKPYHEHGTEVRLILWFDS